MVSDLSKFLHIATQPAVTDKFVAIAEQPPAQANQDHAHTNQDHAHTNQDHAHTIQDHAHTNQDHAHTIQDDPSTHEGGDKCPYSLSDIFVSFTKSSMSSSCDFPPEPCHKHIAWKSTPQCR